MVQSTGNTSKQLRLRTEKHQDCKQQKPVSHMVAHKVSIDHQVQLATIQHVLWPCVVLLMCVAGCHDLQSTRQKFFPTR